MLDAVPALRALRRGFPAAEITLVSSPWAGDFAHRFGHYVDRFVPFYGFPDPRDEAAGPFSFQPTTRDSGDRRYDLVVQLLDGHQKSNAWARALGGRMTAGYYVDDPPPYLTLAVSYPEERSEVERLLYLTRMLGCPSDDTALEFPLFLEDQVEARRALSRFARSSLPSVALHTTSRMDVHHAACVAEAMVSTGQCTMALLGESALSVARRMGTRPPVIANPFSLAGLAAVFARMDLVITADAGALRLAQAVGVDGMPLHSALSPVEYAGRVVGLIEDSAVS